MDKTSKQLERYCKGVSNHRRIEILFLLKKTPNLSLDEIAVALKGNFKTISAHTHRLVQAGLLRKSRAGMQVKHALSPFGQKFHKFLNSFGSAE
jgi:predicted transcriptional regulator